MTRAPLYFPGVELEGPGTRRSQRIADRRRRGGVISGDPFCAHCDMYLSEHAGEERLCLFAPTTFKSLDAHARRLRGKLAR